MRVLALEPYYGGSHRAFLDGWHAHSDHQFTIVGLPAYKWKWRMRQSAITMAQDCAERLARGEVWDVLFCSDMLNLAEFRGLAPLPVARLPAVVYFHENQLTYPVRYEKERDYQFGLTNLTSCLSAEEVWFNSEFHRRDFLGAIPRMLRKMPDYRPLDAVEKILERSCVEPPGIQEPAPRSRAREQGPMHILWAARWEFDKSPETFFRALRLLRTSAVGFRLSVVGESFRESPRVFVEARCEFDDEIVDWGFLPVEGYRRALARADVVVSTARHEFFGLSVVEAVAAGAYPVVPDRLAYPELFDAEACPEFFYDGRARSLAGRLRRLAKAITEGTSWKGNADRARRRVVRFFWKERAAALDRRLELLRARRARDAGSNVPRGRSPSRSPA